MLSPYTRAVLILAISTVGAIGASTSVIFIADILLADFTARFDNYAFAFGIPLGVSPMLVYPLVHVNYRMEMVQAQLERMVRTDPLTGLANRRAFFEQAEKDFDGAARPGTVPIAVMMVDIDHFKQINDNCGHAVGDVALKHVGQTIKNAVANGTRADCLVARIGGEEFAVLLTGDAANTATAIAESICSHVRRSDLQVGDVCVTATVSIGVASRIGSELIDAVMSAADRAVYQAKRAGRDRWLLARKEGFESHPQQNLPQGCPKAESRAA